MWLSERERITLLIIRGFGDRQRSVIETKELFNTTFPNREPISKSTVVRTVQRFEVTGCCRDKLRSGRPKSASSDEKKLETLLHFVQNPHLSLRKAATQVDVCFKSIDNILKTSNFHPYKITLVQELSEDDFDRRLEFCEVMMQKHEENNKFFNQIVFTDEATFMLNGSLNRHNCRYWADQNPHWMRETHTQHPQKVNVWAGIIGNRLVGPFFIEGNLNVEMYLHMLQNEIVPAINNEVGPLLRNTWFQQDGAPPHFGLAVRNYLNNTFPNRWIGRRGPIEWPARSPDLTPLDYFLWGHLKNKVFVTIPADLNELRGRIIEECASINQEMLQNVIDKFYYNLAHCQTVGGGHFQHLIK
jgi:transposase